MAGHPADAPSAARQEAVLLLGSSGFLGRHLETALQQAGYRVIGASRAPEGPGHVQVDFMSDHDPEAWLPRLAGVDFVINAVGILQERRGQTFSALHTEAPQALFAACAIAGVRHVVQISALGADSALTEYFRSKLRADEYLNRLPVAWTVVRPSLVYGEDGASSRLFHTLASLPVIPLPGGGHQPVQPIHVEDLADAVVAMLHKRWVQHRVIALVGTRPVTLREYLAALRDQLGLAPGRFVTVPRALMQAAAGVGRLLPGSFLHPDALAMLERGSTDSVTATRELLGRPPREVASFIPAQNAAGLRIAARMAWLATVVRGSLALLWLWSGIVSLWLYPRAASLELLRQAHVPASLQEPTLIAAAGADMALGLACLFGARLPWIWLAQIVLVLGYTLIITLWLPQFWLHPFGPVAKNVPILAALAVLHFQARDRWNTSP